MSGITLTNAQQILDALLVAQATGANPFGSVSVAGDSYTYRDGQDLTNQINYWARVVAGLQRAAAGESRHGFVVSNFQSRQ